MTNRKIYITPKDKSKLKSLLSAAIGVNSSDLNNVKELLEEIERAEVISDYNIDENVITMNSTVVIKDIDAGKEFEYTIVYPEYADSSKNKISVLTPIGTVLLGYRVGDIIEWKLHGIKRRFQVQQILFQPEAAFRLLKK